MCHIGIFGFSYRSLCPNLWNGIAIDLMESVELKLTHDKYKILIYLNNTIMNHKTHRNRARRNHVAFPHFANMINDIMNTPIQSVVKDKVHTTPAVNVKQDDKEYTIEMSIPGYSKNDINIEIKENKLVISSEIEKSTEETYRLKEFSYGAFKRSFNLPKDADQENISAKVENGILHLTISKKPEALPKQIVIK